MRHIILCIHTRLHDCGMVDSWVTGMENLQGWCILGRLPSCSTTVKYFELCTCLTAFSENLVRMLFFFFGNAHCEVGAEEVPIRCGFWAVLPHMHHSVRPTGHLIWTPQPQSTTQDMFPCRFWWAPRYLKHPWWSNFFDYHLPSWNEHCISACSPNFVCARWLHMSHLHGVISTNLLVCYVLSKTDMTCWSIDGKTDRHISYSLFPTCWHQCHQMGFSKKRLADSP